MLQSLELKNYRSHKDLSLEFSPQTNVIIGLNGAGKTNILEAILYSYTGKSYRAKDIHLITHNETQSRITSTFIDDIRIAKLDIQQPGVIKKEFLINQKKLSRLGFQHTLPVVMFEPEFMQMISRGPEARRDYFDTLLSHTLQGYNTQLNKYKRIMAQRNTLLKTNPQKDQLFVWDVKLSQVGGVIASRRQQLIDKINEKISEIYSHLSNTETTVQVVYDSQFPYVEYGNKFLLTLQKNVATDIERGFTTCGPHREDFSFFINNQDVSRTASRGENRTLLLALKIFEMKLVETLREQKPLLLLDDVFSELDEVRQTKLIEYFSDNQVVITTTTITPLMRGVSGSVIDL